MCIRDSFLRAVSRDAEAAVTAGDDMKEPRKNAKPEPLKSQMSPDAGCASSEPFALRVLGDSMEPEFKDGCIVIVDPSGVVAHGAFVVAETDAGPILRQLVVDGEQRLLKPLNAGYATEPLLRRTLGVVVQRAGVRRQERKHYA